MRRGWVLILGVCAMVYANSLHNGFHYDDEHSIQKNIHIRRLENIPAFFTDPAMFSVDAEKGMYRPLLLVTYALNFAVGKYQVFGYHVVNILLHGLNACLVWWLGRLLFGRGELALVAGLLFALHPVGTEPVNYISSRSESLAALFYLLGLGLFISGVQGRSQIRMAGSWGALALGLLGKSTVITLPAVLLVCDYLLLSRRRWEEMRKVLLKRHGPFWGISAAYLILITANKFLTRSLGTPVRDGWTQLLTQVEAFAYYLRLLLWPFGLNVEHQFFEQQSLLEAPTVVALLLLGSFFYLLFYLYRKRFDLVLFLNLWGILALLPVMVMPLNVLVNERRLYLPGVAFCLGLALVLRWARRPGWRLGGQDLGRILALLVLLVYGISSFSRNRAWADDFTLWHDTIAKAPLMPRPHLYLGNAHKDVAQRTEDHEQMMLHWRAADASYNQVIKLGSNRELALRALNNLGSVHFTLQNYQAAEEAYTRAVELNPRYADALVNLGNINLIYARQSTSNAEWQRLMAASIQYYERGLQIRPNHLEGNGNLGVALQDLGQYGKAKQAFERAYFLNPNDATVLSNLGKFYLLLAKETRQRGEEGRDLLLQSRSFFQRAMRANPAKKEPGQMLREVAGLLGGNP